MIFFTVACFILGLIIGSFINVCIYRIPRDLSIISPGSRCPRCGAPVRWHDNIPVISYLWLRGKCRLCGAGISLQYPAVELLTAVLFALVGWRYAFSTELPLFLLFTFVLITVSGIDFEHQIIPDVFSYGLMAAGLALSFLNTLIGYAPFPRFVNALLGAVVGGGSLFLAGYAGALIFKQEAMGGGDIKLLAGIGAFLGWERVLATIFIASVGGALFGLALIIMRRIGRRSTIPFGPFLSAAAYLQLFLPDPAQILRFFYGYP